MEMEFSNNEENDCCISENPEQSAILHALCTLCAVLCPSKPVLLEHMKQEHGILQPYQCFACLKRYTSCGSLYQHKRKYCKRKHCSQQVNTTTYTLPSYIYDCHLDNWSPIYGELLSCMRIDGEDFVAVMFINQVVGRVPQSLTHAFLQFLENGSIHVRIAGTVIGCGYGMQIPADYIFEGDNLHLSRLVEEVERNQVKIEDVWRGPDAKVSKLEDSEFFNNFQRADKHTPSRIPATENKKYAQRRCKGCKKHGIRRDTTYYCKDCIDFPALCKDCFRDYHL